MTKHYNPSIVERANRILASKAGDFLPDEVAGPVATIAIEPVCDLLFSGSNATTGAGTIATTAAGKSTYVTGFTYQIQCDATCDSTSYSLRAFVGGVQQNLVIFRKLTLTATTLSQVIMLPKPILVDAGTVISINQSFTVGTSTHATAIYGYTEETKKV